MNINRVVLTGNLTADPEVRKTQSGTSVSRLRVASTGRRKDASGTWTDKTNYFDVIVWGRQAEAAAEYLSRGSPVAVDGRLEWREWATEAGEKRQAVEIIAETIQFLPSPARRDDPPAAEPSGSDPPEDIPF
jgi:single-strand DNA-binding protein